MPVEIDLAELLAVHTTVRACAGGLDVMSEQYDGLPGGADRSLIRARRSAEHESLLAEKSSPLQDLR